MASAYVDYQFEQDPDELADAAFAFLEDQFTDWEPNAGNLDTIMVEALSRIAAVIATVASSVPPAIFRTFGQRILRVAPEDPTPATANVVFNFVDDAGYELPAGTTVDIQGQGFELDSNYVHPSGATATAPIPMRAVEDGAAGSGLTGSAELVDRLQYVISVELQDATFGGSDGETDDEYQDRLARTAETLTVVPILADDFVKVGKLIDGVDRMLVLDNFDPSDGSDDNEKMVAWCALDSAGNEISGGLQAVVQALFESRRENNFIVNQLHPTFTPIDITYEATVYPGADPAAVKTAADAALAAYASSKDWGQPPRGDERLWLLKPTVSLGDVYTVLNLVEDLDEVTLLKIGLDSGAQAAADATLPGYAPLPTLGTIDGTVT